ncbi:MAG: extracellular solute-binding protein [Pseudomonadota bacterium]
MFGATIFSFLNVACAADAVLNLYSARHYQTDEALYNDFTKRTGIKINRIEAGDEPLLERVRQEGRHSPADVLLLVDAARLWKAQAEGLFQPVNSALLNARIPANLRAQAGDKGIEWFAFSTRARVIVYNKASIKPDDVQSYEDLASPKMAGRVCTRSGAHPYMLSLVGSMIEHQGEQATEKWARQVVANMARKPQGGDTDQIKAVASGECGVALTNSYYWVRLLRSANPQDKEIVSRVGFIWPNQKNTGTHMNIAGGGVLKYAPNPEAARKFLDYLASDAAQIYFANGNNEWPAVKLTDNNRASENLALESLGAFKVDTLSVERIGARQAAAQKLLDRAGYP